MTVLFEMHRCSIIIVLRVTPDDKTKTIINVVALMDKA
jgi:hypothetical protein